MKTLKTNRISLYIEIYISATLKDFARDCISVRVNEWHKQNNNDYTLIVEIYAAYTLKIIPYEYVCNDDTYVYVLARRVLLNSMGLALFVLEMTRSNHSISFQNEILMSVYSSICDFVYEMSIDCTQVEF